jgi:hypothetical protein
VIVLNTSDAVKAFSHGGNVTLGVSRSHDVVSIEWCRVTCPLLLVRLDGMPKLQVCTARMLD